VLRKPRLALVRECISNAKRVALMRHLANPALNLQVEASNAAAPELAGVVVPHTASIQMHAAQNQIFGLVLALNGQFSSRLPACREFLDERTRALAFRLDRASGRYQAACGQLAASSNWQSWMKRVGNWR
jgi:hypothetical protein